MLLCTVKIYVLIVSTGVYACMLCIILVSFVYSINVGDGVVNKVLVRMRVLRKSWSWSKYRCMVVTGYSVWMVMEY